MNKQINSQMIQDNSMMTNMTTTERRYKNESIASPFEMNNPSIESCVLEWLEITLSTQSAAAVSAADVPSCGSPASFTMPSSSNYSTIKGLCLVNEKHIFQMEENVFKVSLYGTIHRGWIVERSNDDNEFKRTTEEYQVVIKKFKKTEVEALSRADDPIQEFSALQEIGDHHPNVLGQITCLEDEVFYYSIMRFCEGGELCSEILGVGPMDEIRAKAIFLQLLDALEYIQSKGIFHRDISLENILITTATQSPTQSRQVILIDFGMCLKVAKHPENPSQPLLLPAMPAKGKKSYMAPEIVAESKPFNGFASDIWSLGVVLFTILTGKFIVQHASPLCQLFRHVRAGRLKDMCQHWRLGLSNEVQDLLFDMLSVDPRKRPTVADIRKYSWCDLNEEDVNISAPGA